MDIFQTNCIACNKTFAVPILSNIGVLCNACSKQGSFRKQLVITGITRMNQGRVCVSGVDLETLKFVRPVFGAGLNRDFTMDGSTQVVQHFNVVELEFKNYRPSKEFHTEDWLINETFAPKFIRHLTTEQVKTFLDSISISDLKKAIERKDKSLFVIKSPELKSIVHVDNPSGKLEVRFTFVDRAGNQYNSIPVNDLLILAWIKLQIKKKYNYNEELIKRFNSNPFRYLRIGLTRVFLGRPWEQVTALFTIPDLFAGESFATLEKKLGEQF